MPALHELAKDLDSSLPLEWCGNISHSFFVHSHLLSTMARFWGLSTEVLPVITDLLDPSSVFNCSPHKAFYLQPIGLPSCQISRTQSKYQVVYDGGPLNVIISLRQILIDPNVACHMRKLETWFLRGRFSDWCGVRGAKPRNCLEAHRPGLLSYDSGSYITRLELHKLWKRVRSEWRDFSNLTASFLRERGGVLFTHLKRLFPHYLEKSPVIFRLKVTNSIC